MLSSVAGLQNHDMIRDIYLVTCYCNTVFWCGFYYLWTINFLQDANSRHLSKQFNIGMTKNMKEDFIMGNINHQSCNRSVRMNKKGKVDKTKEGSKGARKGVIEEGRMGTREWGINGRRRMGQRKLW